MQRFAQHIEAIGVSLLLGLLLLCSVPAFAHSPQELSRAFDGLERRSSALQHRTVHLPDGAQVRIVSHPTLRAFSSRLKEYVKQSHGSFTQLFGATHNMQAEVHLLGEREFFELTGAPRWTNAMYYRGRILIPVNPTKGLNEAQLFRSLRHEYTHAVLHHLSDGRCPGWLDEGIAQWIEGEENPVLNPALRRWLRTNGLIPFSMLGGGFTGLRSEVVAPAYAQSLFAARYLIDKYGFEGIQIYLSALKAGYSDERAFQTAFHMPMRAFERLLEQELRTWQGTPQSTIAGDLSEVRAMFHRPVAPTSSGHEH